MSSLLVLSLLVWNPGIQAAVKKVDAGWTLELLIPTRDVGELGPTKAYPWGVNVCRTRRASGEPECCALSPTGEMRYCVLSKLGNLSVQ